MCLYNWTQSTPLTDIYWLRSLPQTADHPRQESCIECRSVSNPEPGLPRPGSSALPIELLQSRQLIKVQLKLTSGWNVDK